MGILSARDWMASRSLLVCPVVPMTMGLVWAADCWTIFWVALGALKSMTTSAAAMAGAISSPMSAVPATSSWGSFAAQ